MASDKKFDLEGFSVEKDGGINTDGDINLSSESAKISSENQLEISTGDGGIVLDPRTNVTVETPLIVTGPASSLTVNSDVIFTSLPTSDPSSAGELWVDSSAGYAIKVSQG